MITILILVILAGLTIATLKNTNLFNNALKAKEKSDYEAAKEAIELKLSAINTEYEMNGNGEAKLQYTAERLDPEKDGDIEYVRAEYKEEASIQGIKQGKNMTKIYTKLIKYKYLFEINDNIQIASIDGKKVNEIKISDANIVNGRDSLITNNSKLIGDVNIYVDNITSSGARINLTAETKTDNIIGYIICKENKAIDVTNTMPYKITNLQKDSIYKNVYIIAIDEDKNIKKSNEITITTPKVTEIYDCEKVENILDAGFISTPFRCKGCGGSLTYPTVNKNQISNLGSSSQGTLYYKQLIDMSKYEKMTIVISSSKVVYSGNYSAILLTSSNPIGDLYPFEGDNWNNVKTKIMANDNSVTYTYDLNGVDGEKYICLFSNAGTSYCVEKIELY